MLQNSGRTHATGNTETSASPCRVPGEGAKCIRGDEQEFQGERTFGESGKGVPGMDVPILLSFSFWQASLSVWWALVFLVRPADPR